VRTALGLVLLVLVEQQEAGALWTEGEDGALHSDCIVFSISFYVVLLAVPSMQRGAHRAILSK
jgi:hypothetical protein